MYEPCPVLQVYPPDFLGWSRNARQDRVSYTLLGKNANNLFEVLRRNDTEHRDNKKNESQNDKQNNAQSNEQNRMNTENNGLFEGTDDDNDGHWSEVSDQHL